MPRKQTTQVGIVLGTVRNSNGYEWFEFETDEPGGRQEVIAPKGAYIRLGQGRFSVTGGETQSEHRLGRDRALSAVRAFVKLARVIQVTDTRERRESAKELIVQFSDEYGLLWGDNDHRSHLEWSKEAREFLDMYEIHLRLRERRGWTLQNRFVNAPDDTVIWFRGQSKSLYTVANNGEFVENRENESDEPEVIDYFERASVGTTAAKLQMVLAKQVNKKLSGGLSFSASETNAMRSIVAPRRLLHLLWLKLYLMTIDGESLEREKQCLLCGKEIEGRSNRKYCDSVCRSKHNRQKNSGLIA